MECDRPRHVEVYVAAVSSTPKISVLKGPLLSPAPGFRSPLSHGEEPLSRRERQTRWAWENGLFSGTKGKSCGGDSGSQLKDLPLRRAGRTFPGRINWRDQHRPAVAQAWRGLRRKRSRVYLCSLLVYLSCASPVTTAILHWRGNFFTF